MVVALVAVSGCFWQMPGARWNRSGHNDLETKITVETVAGLEQRWDATLDDGPVGEPVTSTRGVHVNDDRSVYSFNASTGAERWQHTPTDPRGAWQPYVWNDRVLATLATWDPRAREVVEVDAATGETLRVTPGDLVAVKDDEAVLVTNEWVDPGPGPIFAAMHLTVQDLETGETRLDERFNTALEGVPPDRYAVTFAGDWVVHAGIGANLEGTHADGLRGYSLSNPDLDCATPWVDLCPNWFVADAGSDPVVVSEDGAVVYDDASAYDTATGDLLWSRSTGEGGPPTPAEGGPPALADGMLYMADDADGGAGTLRVYDAAGCQPQLCDPLWTAGLGFTADLSVQPAVAGGVVFVAGTGGELAAFDAAGCGAPPCAPLWTGSVGSTITGSPAVSNGQLYVGTADGRLVAFGLPAT
jgi:outer membrane protein assembly factor BamB